MMIKAYQYFRIYLRKYTDRLLSILDAWLVLVYCYPSPIFRKLLIRPIFEFRRLILLQRRGLFFQIFILEGKAANTGSSIRAAYFAEGHNENKNIDYLETILFENGAGMRQQRGACSIRLLPRTATELAREVDLVVIERNSLLGWKPKHGSWVIGPTWVRMVFDFKPDETWEQVKIRFKKHQQNIRRFVKAGYSYTVSHKDTDFEFFYNRMHLPMIDTRHKEYGMVSGKEDLYPNFKQGHIMNILDQDRRPVAGALNMVRGDVIIGVVNGVLDGDKKWMEAGASSALYYFIIQWCLENRIRRCDICGARPFAFDGLYTYKRRWGFHPVADIWKPQEWLFWAPAQSPAVMKWLEMTPFIPEFAEVGSKVLDKVYKAIPSLSA